MERNTKIMAIALGILIATLIGLLIWQAMERAKWERAFAELNGSVLQSYIMANPEVILLSLQNHLERNYQADRGFVPPRQPKEYEASIDVPAKVFEKLFDNKI